MAVDDIYPCSSMGLFLAASSSAVRASVLGWNSGFTRQESLPCRQRQTKPLVEENQSFVNGSPVVVPAEQKTDKMQVPGHGEVIWQAVGCKNSGLLSSPGPPRTGGSYKQFTLHSCIYRTSCHDSKTAALWSFCRMEQTKDCLFSTLKASGSSHFGRANYRLFPLKSVSSQSSWTWLYFEQILDSFRRLHLPSINLRRSFYPLHQMLRILKNFASILWMSGDRS